MFKINLESKLIEQNKSVVTSRELLLIEEYDRLGDMITNDKTIHRVFGETAAHQGKRVKYRVDALLQETKQYDQSRVFHISQIERLCNKYYLRFLPTIYYNGTIDKETAAKISQFEIANSVTCCGGSLRNIWRYDDDYKIANTFIAAPASSFKLQEKPKDPLLFYKINDEYYYLIHKWGNDLNIFRRVLPILSSGRISNIVGYTILILLSIYLFTDAVYKDQEGDNQLTTAGAFGVVCIVTMVILFIIQAVHGELFAFIKKNKWNSEFRDE